MNIIETVILNKKKCVFLISSYLWWPELFTFVNALADNLQFKVVIAEIMLPNLENGGKLITSTDQINFTKLNEIIGKDYSGGVIIVGYSFPPEKMEFFADFHVNINVSPSLLSSISVELLKKYSAFGLTRIDIEQHLSYISKTWKNNKISKFITVNPNYNDDELNKLYSYMFDAIMDGIAKKIYGEKYDEFKKWLVADPKQEKFKIPQNQPKQLTNIYDETVHNVNDLIEVENIKAKKQATDDFDNVALLKSTKQFHYIGIRSLKN